MELKGKISVLFFPAVQLDNEIIDIRSVLTA